MKPELMKKLFARRSVVETGIFTAYRKAYEELIEREHELFKQEWRYIVNNVPESEATHWGAKVRLDNEAECLELRKACITRDYLRDILHADIARITDKRDAARNEISGVLKKYIYNEYPNLFVVDMDDAEEVE